MGGLSSASFYAAFGSKESLYREALGLYLHTHGLAVAPLYDLALAPRERIEQALRASARMQSGEERPKGCLVALSSTVGSPESESVRALTASERRANRDAIRGERRSGGRGWRVARRHGHDGAGLPLGTPTARATLCRSSGEQIGRTAVRARGEQAPQSFSARFGMSSPP